MMERIGATRVLSPVASLSPWIIGWRESATVVSMLMSTPVRPGTLYSTIGSSTASAICVKWLSSPPCVGFT